MSRLSKIEGYDLYFVSEDGKVFSDKYKIRRELSQRRNSRGYMYVNLCKNGKYKSISVHKLVASAFLAKPIGKNEVNHIDGNKTNNDISNLEWVDKSTNIQHAFKNGLNKPRKHEKHHAAKLKEEDVVVIRDRFRKGEMIVSISKSYPNVSYECIKGVCSNRYWI